MRARILWSMALALAAAALLACSGGRVSADVVVAGGKAWTPTGITVKPGETLAIKATGKVFANEAVSGDPDGVTGHPDWRRYNVVPEANHVALIGKIGENGKPFAVGSRFSQTVAANGQLFLGPNDRDTSNDRGEFKATVTVK